MKLVLREDAVHTGLGTEAPWLIAVASQLHLGTTAPQISLHSFSFVRFVSVCGPTVHCRPYLHFT